MDFTEDYQNIDINRLQTEPDQVDCKPKFNDLRDN